jgi:hypothetical protein
MADQNATLVLHRGAREVSREELDGVEAPQPTDTWFPVKHATVIQTVHQQLQEAGFAVRRARFGLSRSNHRMFATLDLTSQVHADVFLAVGVRNSTDQSFPLGFCAGARTFVCDNLAFRSELVVTKKHTRFGQFRFQGEIARSIVTLQAFQEHETQRHAALMSRDLPDQEAEAIMLRSFENGIVSHLVLRKVVQEWREPTYPVFRVRTAWSLLNAFTTVIGPRAVSNPMEHARTTMRVGALIDSAVGIGSFAVPAIADAVPTTAA